MQTNAISFALGSIEKKEGILIRHFLNNHSRIKAACNILGNSMELWLWHLDIVSACVLFIVLSLC